MSLKLTCIRSTARDSWPSRSKCSMITNRKRSSGDLDDRESLYSDDVFNTGFIIDLVVLDSFFS